MIKLRTTISNYREEISLEDEHIQLILNLDSPINKKLKERIKILVEAGIYTEIEIKEVEDLT